MTKTNKSKFNEIAAFINKRLEGFDFVLISSNPLNGNDIKYVSNLKRGIGVDVLFKAAVQLELKESKKLSKLEILNKLRKNEL